MKHKSALPDLTLLKPDAPRGGHAGTDKRAHARRHELRVRIDEAHRQRLRLEILQGVAQLLGPFRIGEELNLRYGVAMEDEEALRLHETLASHLWETALRESKAVDETQKLLK